MLLVVLGDIVLLWLVWLVGGVFVVDIVVLDGVMF